MKRPYVICHMLSSLDGKINGPFMAESAALGLSSAYGEIREMMGSNAWMYGTVTTAEFTDFAKPELEKNAKVPEGDFVAEHHEKMYYVSLDTEGQIGWKSAVYINHGKPSHVIEILTESTPAAYKAFLRKKGISYILAGKDALDCKKAVEKLYELFDIKKLVISGGGMINWTFLQAGMIDELSLVLAPLTDGGSGSASLFTKQPSSEKGTTVRFDLKAVEHIGGNALHLTYSAENSLKD